MLAKLLDNIVYNLNLLNKRCLKSFKYVLLRINYIEKRYLQDKKELEERLDLLERGIEPPRKRRLISTQ